MKKTILSILSLFISLSAYSQTEIKYPTRPIKMIVAYSAGGGTDIAARTLVPFIEKYLGGSITVINRPGAGGEVGFTELAQAKPDGYTIGFINTPNLLSIPIQRKTRYGLKDIQAVANIIYDPGAFSFSSESEIKTFEDMIAFAKENPGKLTYGSTGVGSDDHLAALAFERITGVKLGHVPFPGNVDVRAATLGGHIMMASMNISETVEDMEQGNLHAIGQMGENRWEKAPDTPTFIESGYDVIMGSNRGIGAPAGVDNAILNKLSSAIEKAVADPDFIIKAEEQYLPLNFENSSDFGVTLNNLDELLRELWVSEPWDK